MIGAGRIERYVVGRVMGSVGAALAVISAVILLVEFVDLSRGVGVKADVSVGQVFWLTLLRAPSLIQVLLPFASNSEIAPEASPTQGGKSPSATPPRIR